MCDHNRAESLNAWCWLYIAILIYIILTEFIVELVYNINNLLIIQHTHSKSISDDLAWLNLFRKGAGITWLLTRLRLYPWMWYQLMDIIIFSLLNCRANNLIEKTILRCVWIDISLVMRLNIIISINLLIMNADWLIDCSTTVINTKGISYYSKQLICSVEREIGKYPPISRSKTLANNHVI